MNLKKFIMAGLLGGITDFLLGWLFYGILFVNFFPQDENMSMLLIFLGCLTFGFFISYIYNKWAAISTAVTGLKAGSLIGLFLGLMEVFFKFASTTICYKTIALTLFINICIGAGVGAIVGLLNGKLSK